MSASQLPQSLPVQGKTYSDTTSSGRTGASGDARSNVANVQAQDSSEAGGDTGGAGLGAINIALVFLGGWVVKLARNGGGHDGGAGDGNCQEGGEGDHFEIGVVFGKVEVVKDGEMFLEDLEGKLEERLGVYLCNQDRERGGNKKSIETVADGTGDGDHYFLLRPEYIFGGLVSVLVNEGRVVDLIGISRKSMLYRAKRATRPLSGKKM